MALMFQRLAHNFMKNGYYPTDSETTQRILNALIPAEKGEMRVLDPCCGEGVALAEVQQHLGAEQTQSYGVEYDEERAWHAKELLNQCIHGDLQDCLIGKRQFGLMWLNPPYGDLVANQAGGISHWKGRKRLEKLFYSLTNGMLQFGGIMVLIIPNTSLDKELSDWIARHFERVQVFLAPEQRYKQVVVMGVRRRVSQAVDMADVRHRLIAVGMGELPGALPRQWDHKPYTVPATQDNRFEFALTRLDQRQLSQAIGENDSLWRHFGVLFGRVATEHRRPLRALSDWHLGLALAAGQVSGVVPSQDGRIFVIKGDTHKEKKIRVESTVDDKGRVQETRIHTDIFVPAIHALDFTPGSVSYGKALVIR